MSSRACMRQLSPLYGCAVVDDLINRLQGSIARTGFSPQQVFARLDTNGDKRLSYDELMFFVIQLQGNLSVLERRTLFQKFDVDGSGDVDVREFCDTLGQGASIPNRRVRHDTPPDRNRRSPSMDSLQRQQHSEPRSHSLTPLKTLVREDACRDLSPYCHSPAGVSIDCQTAIPSELFKDFALAGAQARTRGQHELRKKPSTSSGQPLLVHPQDSALKASVKAPPRLPALLFDLAKHHNSRPKISGNVRRVSPSTRYIDATNRSSRNLRCRRHSLHNAVADQ